jgi:hypothetical protein
MVIFTILSKTDGGPSSWTLVAGAAVGAAPMVRREVMASLLLAEGAERATRRAEATNMIGFCF